MYSDYFKLKEPPFSLTPDPRFLYMSDRHREGFAHLLYGVQRSGGFVQLSGEIGSGKTTLCRCLISQLPPDTDVALILNPRLTVIELLATVCDELRIQYPPKTDSVKVLIDSLNQHLLEMHARGRRTVLIIDEAQNLHSDVLEQVRLLTNLETSQEKLLQIILIGQPELISLLKSERLRQLAQRITARYHLFALSRKETYSYIQHRLLVAGRRDPLFSKRAMRLIYRLSGGMPRLINIICDRALLGAYALDKQWVSAAIVRRASRETKGLVQRNRGFRLALIGSVAVLAALAVGGAMRFGLMSRFIPQRNRVAANSNGRTAAEKTDPITSLAKQPPAGEGSAIGNAKSTKLDQPIIAPAEAKKGLAAALTPGEETTSGKPSTGLRLAEVLADPSTRGSAASSFAGVYALWGATFPLDQPRLGCKAGLAEGFTCLFKTGTWLKLRRYDLPAILELVLPDGTRSQAALTSLGDDTATLAIGKYSQAFPLSEIDKVWDGSFIIVWKPPIASAQLSYGDRGEDVKWLRNALDRLEGKTPNPADSDVYDENLRQRVAAFQKERLLIPDGRVGSETLARLALAMEGSKALSLSHRSP
jgi:general secretion pathway protein A